MTPPRGPVGLISNPGSGHNRDQFSAVLSRINHCEPIRHIVTKSPDDIGPALTHLAKEGISTLAINGGDGTASQTLGYLLEHGVFADPPVIALLPGGTANMNAGDIGIAGKLPQAVDQFCLWSEGKRTAKGTAARALLRVVTGDDAIHHGMFLGAGAVIQGTEYAHQEVHARGVRDDLSLLISVVRTVWGLTRNDPRFSQHVNIDLQVNDAPRQSFDALILVISTLERLAFGMRPFWGPEPGNLRFTLFERGCSRFARTFISIARGRPNRNAIPASGYRSHNADQLVLALEGNINLDGEILDTAGHLSISATRCLHFLQL
ncbi:MAG: diacylglycerol kinase family protein [Pseudomonadota bacterium]